MPNYRFTWVHHCGYQEQNPATQWKYTVVALEIPDAPADKEKYVIVETYDNPPSPRTYVLHYYENAEKLGKAFLLGIIKLASCKTASQDKTAVNASGPVPSLTDPRQSMFVSLPGYVRSVVLDGKRPWFCALSHEQIEDEVTLGDGI